MQNDNIKKFDVSLINEVSTESSDEFYFGNMCVLSTRPNSHKVNITKEILRRDGESIRGKWVVAYPKDGEFMSHHPDEVIVGIIPQDAKITFVEDSDGYLLMYADVVLSKLYGKAVYDMFKLYNFHNVSVEMATFDDTERDDGSIDISGFKIYSVTVLGQFIKGSCPDANLTITQFSTDKAQEYYHSVVNFEEKYVNHSMDKKSYVETDWDGEKAKHDAVKEEKFDTYAKDIFLKLDADYKERKIGSLHYPVMGLYDGVWKYNKNGLSSARAYGEQHDKDVADKAIAIQKKLGLYEETQKEEKTMADDSKKKDDVIMAETEEKKEKEEVIEKKDDVVEKKEMSEGRECADDNKKVVIKAEDTDDKKVEDDAKKEKEMGCHDREMADGEEEADGKEKPMAETDTKDFSEITTILAHFGEETSENKQKIEAFCKMSAIEQIDTMLKFSKECEELKSFKAEIEDKEKTAKLSALLSDVKGDIDEKTFNELKAESESVSFADMTAFENKVKAFAYEATKSVNKGDVMSFAGVVDVFNDTKETSANDIFEKYL